MLRCYRYVVKELEKGDEDGVSNRQKMLRSKISDIIKCDLELDYPLLKKYPPFDVLSMNMCIEVVAPDIGKFTDYLKLLRSLLKDGGYMSLLVSLEETYYYVVRGARRYPHLYVTSDDVRMAFKESGFEILRVQRFDIPLKSQIPSFNDCKAMEHFSVKKLAM